MKTKDLSRELTKRFNVVVQSNEGANMKLLKTFKWFSEKYPNARINGKSYDELKRCANEPLKAKEKK